jgi:SOS-response transcriptional repressor LexA
MLSEILERIEQRLAELGMNATQASVQAGLHRDAIRNIRRAAQEKRTDGRLGVQPRTIAALAKVLDTSPGWLLTGRDERTPEEGDGAANGAAGAGFLPFVEWDEAADYTSPDKPIRSDTSLGEHVWPRGTFVTRVRDDAMNRIAPAGSYILVDRSERMVSAGLIYLGVLDGQVMLRRWFPNPERAEPFSLDPSFQTEFLRPGRRWDVIGRVRRIFVDV